MSAFPLTAFLLVKFYPLEHLHRQHICPLSAQNTDPIPLDLVLHLSLEVMRKTRDSGFLAGQWLTLESRPAELDDLFNVSEQVAQVGRM